MAASVDPASRPGFGTDGSVQGNAFPQLGAGRIPESNDAAPGSARNNAATPQSPFSQPDLQTSPAKAQNDRLRLPVLESLEDHELSGLTSLTGSELNLYLQVTEEMKREEPAMAKRLLQSASFKRRQSQAEEAAAAPNGPAASSSATQAGTSGATPQSSISSTSTSGRSSASQEQLSKELSDAVERLRGILPADAVGLEHRNSFGLLDLLSSASLADPETAAAANVLAAHHQQQQGQQQQQVQQQGEQQQQPLADIGNSNTGRSPQPVAFRKPPTSGAS